MTDCSGRDGDSFGGQGTALMTECSGRDGTEAAVRTE